jgi:S-adenosylmethionine synthetase
MTLVRGAQKTDCYVKLDKKAIYFSKYFSVKIVAHGSLERCKVLTHYETKPDLNKLDRNKRNFKCNKS